MFCANCGNEFPNGSTFCPKCGTKIGGTEAVGNQQNSVSNLKKSKFRILSKVALLLVVFGFFMPVACNQNGFQMADTGFKLGERGSPAKVSAIFLYILFFSALISIGFTIYTYVMKKKIKTILDFPCLLVSIGAGIIAYSVLSDNDIKILKVLSSGGYSIIIGWITSLAFLMTDTIYSKNMTSAQIKLAETPEKPKKKELTEEEKEQRRIAREKQIKQLKKIRIGAGIVFVLLCVVFHNHVGYIVSTLAYNIFDVGHYYHSAEHYKQAKIKKVKIPEGTKEIESYAFDDWYSLKEVTIPSSVTKIDNDAFSNCKSLTNITIPDSVTYIGNDAFYGCESLTNIITPNRVTYIGENAFHDCKSLKNIAIPNGVKYINKDMFSGCVSLTSVTIPNSVTRIDNGAFGDCKSITNVMYSGTIAQWCEISFGGQSFKGASLTIDGNEITAFAIPYGVKKINNFAFCGYNSLTDVTIPDSVTEIDNNAFNGCNSLTSITIPNSVKKIGEGAFFCISLTNVNYRGTKEQWERIIIKDGNVSLKNAKINFNYTGK